MKAAMAEAGNSAAAPLGTDATTRSDGDKEPAEEIDGRVSGAITGTAAP